MNLLEMYYQILSLMEKLTMEIVLNSSSRKLLKYCEFTTEFLNTKTLRNSKSVKWFADFSNFDFKDEDGVPIKPDQICIDHDTCAPQGASLSQVLPDFIEYWIDIKDKVYSLKRQKKKSKNDDDDVTRPRRRSRHCDTNISSLFNITCGNGDVKLWW